MRTVYQALNPIDAHLVKHALDDAGIPAFVLGEHLIGGVGELPATGFIQVRVPDECFEAAQRLLRDLPMLAGDATEVGTGDNAEDTDDADPGWLTA